jgi:hypothetical protein
MKGDFTRDTFNKKNRFSRVLMQQGRVTLDSDYNEQADILLHYMRTLARDLIGPYGAPAEAPGFKLIVVENKDLMISAGRYYVDGILVENERACLYSEQPNYKLPQDDRFSKIRDEPGQFFWLYLDVWESLVTSIDDDRIREKALGGPDTSMRSKIMWQVRALPVDPVNKSYGYSYANAYPIPYGSRYGYPYPPDYSKDQLPCDEPLHQLVDVSRVRLAARVDPGQKIEDACITPPDSKYRGVENHLYRVEIHRGGNASAATFKWSRDNGSVVTAWVGTSGNDLEVANARGFAAGNWVELSDDIREQQAEEPGLLVRLANVEGGVLSIDPGTAPAGGLPQPKTLVNPKVRRWDQIEIGDIELVDGAVPVTETLATEDAEKATWIDLEDGIQIAFTQAKFAAGGTYRTGDYWLIPARVATGNIEWPDAEEEGKLPLLEPHGVVHHYAPLGYALFKNNQLKLQECYCEFEPLGDCFNKRSYGFGVNELQNRHMEPAMADVVENRPKPSGTSANKAQPAEAIERGANDEAAVTSPTSVDKPVGSATKKRGRRAPAKERQS